MHTENDNDRIKTFIRRLIIAIISIGLFLIVRKYL